MPKKRKPATDPQEMPSPPKLPPSKTKEERRVYMQRYRQLKAEEREARRARNLTIAEELRVDLSHMEKRIINATSELVAKLYADIQSVVGIPPEIYTHTEEHGTLREIVMNGEPIDATGEFPKPSVIPAPMVTPKERAAAFFAPDAHMDASAD